MIASTFSIVVRPLSPAPLQLLLPCTAHCQPDVLFNALPTAAVTATTRTISQDRHSVGRGRGMEIAQETYNLFQFISFCHHLLLVAPLLLLLQLCIALPSPPSATPTIDVDVAYFRFWHVAPLTFRNCPCPCAVSMSPCLLVPVSHVHFH